MTKFILAQKIGMTQIYQDDKAIPVTALEAGPVVVSQIKKQDRDGYYAIQVGFGKKRNLSKAFESDGIQTINDGKIFGRNAEKKYKIYSNNQQARRIARF